MAFLIALAALVFLPVASNAQDSGFTWMVDRRLYVLEANGLWTGTFEFERKMHDAQAARTGGRIDITYSAGQQTIEILEAATLKAGGKVIAVPADKILDIAPQVPRDVSLYTDNRTRSIVFPDVSAGDSIRYVYRLNTFDVTWPGFAWSGAWQTSLRVKRTEITFDRPATMYFATEQHEGMLHRIEASSERVRDIFSWSNDKVVPAEAGATSPLDWSDRFLVSTFKSYTEIGDHYGKLHAASSAITPDVAALAEQIVGPEKDRMAQARLLSEWVAKNVRYVAVAIGQGKLTPVRADQTIGNRYGDCKAQVALLAALLAAKGIASEPALINIGIARYVLPDTPDPWFNHVILYLPEFDLYVDPTSQYSAFGVLSWDHYDKPVLHAVEGRSRTTRVPRMKSEDNVAEVSTTATIWSDGRVTASTRESASGWFATDLKRLASAGTDAAKAAAQLRFFGTPGSGKWTKRNADISSHQAEFISELTLADALDLAAGEALLPPPGLRFLTRPGITMFGTHDTERNHPFPCYAGHQVETIEVILPAGFRPARLPADSNWKISIAEYKSSYAFRNGKLFVQREFTAQPEGQVCQAERSSEIVRLLSNIRRDQRAVVVFGKDP